MANPWGEQASLIFLYLVIASFIFFLGVRLYKCFRRESTRNSQEPLKSQEEEEKYRKSRNSSVDRIFNEFQYSVNIKPTDSVNVLHNDAPIKHFEDLPTNPRNKRKSYLKSNTMFDSMQKTDHINALLNLLAVKEKGKSGLQEEEMYLLKKKSKIFTHADLHSENASFNTTGNIENLSKSFCMNNDLNIRNKPSCMFCLENVNIGDKVIFLEKCRHLFHESCCLEWFTVKNYCPICKKYPFIIEEDISF